MKESNKAFLSLDVFNDRVKRIMQIKNITLEQLYQILVDDVGYDITRNNLSLYLNRIPNVNFLVAISKALDVSTDYLLGIEPETNYSEDFDYNYNSQKYKKYNGDHSIYFLPTVNSSTYDPICAKMKINSSQRCWVTMDIPTPENVIKHYEGELIISKTYSIVCITLRGSGFGEIVNMMFCDHALNDPNASFKLSVGAMLSVSSGDFKRMPVLSRFIISRFEIPKEDVSVINANLRLNSKYIHIAPTDLDEPIRRIFPQETAEEISNRIITAFPPKGVCAVEESFILNTIKQDLGIEDEEINELIISLRCKSMSSTNSKINSVLDSRIYSYLNKKRRSREN